MISGHAWQSSDAWLLASIVLASRLGDDPLSPLARVIACGDATNHAIFNDDEVEDGIRRLRAVGLVDPASFEPTAKGAALYDTAAGVDLLGDLLPQLSQLELPARLPAFRLDRRAKRAAYDEYSARFEER